MANNENIPARLLNHFNDTDGRKTGNDNDLFSQVMLSILIDMPESAFRWDEKRQLYLCTVAGKEVTLRKTSYRGLQYLRKVKNGYV